MGKKTETGVSPRQRRSVVPSRQSSSFSLWSILKNSIGRDLSKIPMPVNYNEPLSMLQRVTEDLDYSFLLDAAAAEKDPGRALSLVAGFSVVFYCCQHERVGKPFNPLLGETFECDRWEESGWRSVAEQVSHHPPILAQHAVGAKGWERHFVFHADPKLRFNYLAIAPKGIEHLHLSPAKHHYSWPKVHTTVHNMVVGRIWLENAGDIAVTNHSTGDVAYLRYHPVSKSIFSFSHEDEDPNIVTGVVVCGGVAKWVLKGRWDSHMDLAPVTQPMKIENEKAAHKAFDKLCLGAWESLWAKKAPLPDYEDMYHMSRIAVTLNEMEEGLAPTDSRLRPDQRLMEEGDWNTANIEKRRLEDKQRKKRNDRGGKEEAGGLWFHQVKCPDTGKEFWRHKAGEPYWAAKGKQDWRECPDIYSSP